MSRRALLAAAALVLSGDTVQRTEVVHTGPARQSPWFPGKPKPRPPAWLYENGPPAGPEAVHRRPVCACSHPPT